MTDISVYRAGLDVGRAPMMGGAHYVFIMYDMWYFGDLTKLCAYGFHFMFSSTSILKGKSVG